MVIADRGRSRRALARVSAFAILLLLLGFASFMPFAGRYLVREDELETADAIFVLAGGAVDRWLESVDLYREQYAKIVVLSPGRTERAETELRARGIRLPTSAQIARDAMIQLGLPPEAVQIMAGNLDNTAQEAEASHELARNAGWRRLIVVTSRYHTRRTRFAFRREFRRSPITVLVRASRHDESDPSRWWRHRADIRFVSSELQKLVLYGMGLGS
jgi:uncharacterized SAM-binding protein YcdF (DUF218 family)